MLPLSSPDVKPASFRSFIGGMVTDIPPMYLQPYQSPNTKNMLPDEEIGALVHREGSIVVGTCPDATPITFLYTFEKSGGTSEVIVSDGTKIWITADFVTFTEKKSGLNSSYILQAITVRDKVWLTNGYDNVMSWNGTTLVTFADRAGAGGDANTPRVPKGKYIAFSQERIWIARTSGDPSRIFFSALHDPSGDPQPPDLDYATADMWPDVNALDCDEDDGDVIYSVRDYIGVPFIFKSNSFGRVTGYDEYSYGYARVMSGVGSRFHTTMKSRDEYLEFIGFDGIYQTRGTPATTVRVSDLIKSEFDKLLQPKVNEQTRVWTSGAHWDTGAYTNTKKGDAIIGIADSTFLQDTLTVIDAFTDGNYTVNPTWTVENGSWSVGVDYGETCLTDGGSGTSTIRLPATLVNGTWECKIRTDPEIVGVTRIRFMVDSSGHYYEVVVVSGTGAADWYLYKNTGGGSVSLVGPISGYNPYGAWRTVKIVRTYLNNIKVYVDTNEIISYTDTDITSSQYFKLESVQYFGGYHTHFDDIKITRYPTAGTNKWVSAKTNIGGGSNISAWGIFEAATILNGQAVTYRIEIDTTEGGLDGTGWLAIVPGQVITGTLTTPWARVEATFVTTDAEKTPELKDISIKWTIGGDSSQSMQSIIFENRHLIAASQVGQSANNIIWVWLKREFIPENQRAAFIPFDWNITAMCIYNDILYGADSRAGGKILRLFYGAKDQNNAGVDVAIDGFWETRDEVFGFPGNKKKLMEGLVDYLAQGAGTINVARSNDDSAYTTVASLDNSGSTRQTKPLAIRGTMGYRHRLRVRKNTIDERMKIYGIEMMAIPFRIRE